MKRIYIGTSGWSYDWPEFYKQKQKGRSRLAFLSDRFNTVEVNNSFYNLPYKRTFKHWRRESSQEFVFSLKLCRYITHMKKLSAVKEPLAKFMKRAEGMKGKLGPVLAQLPKNLGFDENRLKYLLESFDEKNDGRSPGLAVEFRHPSWFEQSKKTEKILRDFNATWVFSHSPELLYPESEPLTGNFAYLRLHGPRDLYGSKYSRNQLSDWAAKIQGWSKQRDVYLYFNNDQHSYAPKNASDLIYIITHES